MWITDHSGRGQKFYEDLYEGEESGTGQSIDSRTEEDERIPDQHVPIPEFTKNEIQDAIDRLKKEKQKTAVEHELNNSKIAVTKRGKNQDDLQ